MKSISKIYILVFACLFTIICYKVATGEIIGFDKPIQEFAISLREAAASKVLIPITYMANPETIVVACLLLLAVPKTRKIIGLPVSISCIISLITYKSIKHIIARPRPDSDLYLVEQGGYSFPSGHSMTAVIFYGVIAVILCSFIKNRQKQQLICLGAVLSAALIGFSRIYVGVHWPSDVAAGFLLGSIYMIIFGHVWRNYQENKFLKKKTIKIYETYKNAGKENREK